jgi:transposase
VGRLARSTQKRISGIRVLAGISCPTGKMTARRTTMEILHTRCAGIDVHKKNVKVCLIITEENGKQKKEIRTYSTMTPQLLELHDWLKEQGCSHSAFEATGVYWKPVFNLLEGDFDILVVNAHQMKAVPGRKTDVKDAK